MTRTLTLKKDTLAELTSDDLSVVVGGSAGTCWTCLVQCLTDDCHRQPIPTLESPCY